jgi:hypothetical protein
MLPRISLSVARLRSPASMTRLTLPGSLRPVAGHVPRRFRPYPSERVEEVCVASKLSD